MSSNQRLLKRDGIYYYRRRVPAPLRARFGRDIIQFSLHTKSRSVALRERSLADVYWDAQFQPSAPPSDSPPPSAIGRTQIEDHVRDYVDKGIAKWNTTFTTRPPGESLRSDMKEETQERLNWLKKYDEPTGAEMIGRAYGKVFGNLEPGALEQMAVDLTRRALIEYETRKLATLNGEFSEFHDPLFNPQRKKSLTFGELAGEFIAKRTLEDSANGLRQKTRDKWSVRVQLIVDLVGGDTPLAEVNYDLCAGIRDDLARIPANRSKIYPGLTVKQATRNGEADGKATISLVTQADYWQALRAILDFAVAKGMLTNNPTATLKPLGNEALRADEKKAAFDISQLASLFSSSFYAEVAAGRGAEFFRRQHGVGASGCPYYVCFTAFEAKRLPNYC